MLLGETCFYSVNTMTTPTKKEAFLMGRRNRGVMSEQFKYELAKDLGFYDTVQRDGWGGITTKDAGNMVKRSIEIAEQALAKQQK
jgi:small acid-soluble spore protein F (minor alpha/beta-type SASP)